MPEYSLHLFGVFSLIADGTPLAGIARTRMQDFLVYLFLHRQHPVARAHIAAALWPETSDVQALKNLRTIYARLRDLVPQAEELVTADNQIMQWTAAASVQVDVLSFGTYFARAEALRRTNGIGAVTAYEAALAAYGGDLLPGDFAPWVIEAREQLRQQWLDAQDALVTLLLAQGEHRRALTIAQALVRADPLSEPAQMRQMEILLAMGNRAGALSVYHECAKLLADELGVDPGAPLQKLYDRVLFADEETEPAQVDSKVSSLPAIEPMRSETTVDKSHLVGRDQELAWLHQRWEGVRTGTPHIALLLGEAGMGKTRLAEEFAAELEKRGAEVIVARSFANARIAYQPVAEWLASRVIAKDLSGVDKAWRLEASRLVPSLLEGMETGATPEPLLHSWQTHRFLQGMAEVLVAGCDLNRPRVLLLDDAQWVDAETFAWIPLLLKAAADRPLLLLMTVRSEDAEVNEAFNSMRQSLLRTGQLSEETLKALDAEATAAVAAELVGQHLDKATMHRLFRETEGNPLFIVEMVRSGFDSGLAKVDAAIPGDRFSIDTMNLPSAIAAMLQFRFEQLSDGARTLAECAAVIGREVNYTLLSSVSQMDEDSLLLRLDELWRRRILRERGSDGYDFSHDKLRQVVYSRLARPRRRVLHRRTGETLVARSQFDGREVQIATHFEESGDLRLAIEWYRRAADDAARLYATAEATRLYQHLLEDPLLGTLSVVERCDVRLALAKSCMVIGKLEEAKALAGFAVEDATVLQDDTRRAWSMLELGNALSAKLEDKEALSLYNETAALFHELNEPRGRLAALSAAGQILLFFGECEGASAIYVEALAIAKQTNDKSMIAEILSETAWLRLHEWKVREARVLALEANVLFESIGAKDKLIPNRVLLGYLSESEVERFGWHTDALRISLDIQDSFGSTRSLGEIGVLLAERGNLKVGLSCILASTEEALEQDNLGEITFGAERIGRALETIGEYALTRRVFQFGQRLAKETGADFVAVRFSIRLATSELVKGKLDSAMQEIEEAHQHNLLSSRQYFFPEWLRCIETCVQWKQGFVSTEEADWEMEKLLACEPRREITVEIAFWRWWVLPNDANRADAIRLLRDYYARWPQVTVRRRYAEITGETLPEPPPLPGVADLVPDTQPLDALLERARKCIVKFETYEVPR